MGAEVIIAIRRGRTLPLGSTRGLALPGLDKRVNFTGELIPSGFPGSDGVYMPDGLHERLSTDIFDEQNPTLIAESASEFDLMVVANPVKLCDLMFH